MEVYVFFTLLGLGYIGSKSYNPKSNASKSKYDKTTSPHSESMYNSNITQQAKDIEDYHVKRMYDKSRNPKKTKVISSNYKDIVDQSKSNKYQSKLSGVDIPIDDFKHNNMKPFFGGTQKQNVNLEQHGNDFLLETYTGSGKLFHDKKSENVCFADINERSGSSPYMKKDSYDDQYDRMIASKMKTNELPFEKKQIGPGLDNGFTKESNQRGFDTNDRDYIMPKTVDELRQGSNPKVNFEGRTLSGQKGSKRGVLGEMNKNKTGTFHERGSEHLFKTTGAYMKNKHRPCHIIKDTNRKHSTSYSGNIYKNIGNEQTGKLQESKRQILQEIGARNLDNQKASKPEWDFGKKNILVYSNERDLTTTKTYQGNIQSLIKSAIAPIQDALRTTPKQYTTFPKHEFGYMQSTNPNKQTIFDPSDVARTTIKETFIHDTRTGTMTGEKASFVYDPDDIMKTTVKETLPDYDNVINMQSILTKQTVYDPDDTAKITVKETTEDSKRDGNLETIEGGGGYETTNYTAPNTQKQFTSDNEFIGSVNKQHADGYLTTNMVAGETNKQFISDNDYYGQAGSKDSKQMSYTDIYNATINETKETLLKCRTPTQNNVKISSGTDHVNIFLKKKDCESKNMQNIQRVYDVPVSKEIINNTKERYEEHENRLDPTILQAFNNNPYTKSLTNSA